MVSRNELDAALKEYLRACYGDPHELPSQQLKEVRQAFLSGIMWRDSNVLLHGQCEEPLRQMLGMNRERN